ncbi:efflux RND transporter periplasmic adaptor subunit [bacterium AH-315-J21]|nr:efflux RND transporter periplasmic adaptor subunit [bacterium AH-315-J21]
MKSKLNIHSGLRTFTKLLIVTAVFQVSSGCSNDKKTAAPIAPIAVRIENPQIRDISEHLTYIAAVHATSEIPVMAQVQGTVVSTPVEEGQTFKEGDLLVKLSSPELDALVDKLNTEHEYWGNHLKEDLNLLSSSSISQQQVDISQKAFETSRASLSEAQSRLNNTREKAKLGGWVLKKYVELGQHVMPGQALLLVGSDSTELHVEVVQEDLRKGIEVGSLVSFRINSRETIDSRVSSIASVTTGAGRTFTVKIPVPSSIAQVLRIGETLPIDFVLEQKEQVLSIPETAVLNKNNKPVIFLVRANKAIRTPVTLGLSQSGWIAAEFDWNGVDPVAISNVADLSDGDSVYPVKN